MKLCEEALKVTNSRIIVKDGQVTLRFEGGASPRQMSTTSTVRTQITGN